MQRAARQIAAVVPFRELKIELKRFYRFFAVIPVEPAFDNIGESQPAPGGYVHQSAVEVKLHIWKGPLQSKINRATLCATRLPALDVRPGDGNFHFVKSKFA